ncbi:MAG: hypothetical protein CMD83_05470 [Gammaproteobacteria bacterium]|nr:hypothetical protein [Gammaproteobacteria bacterium]|tara:strand:- start:277 stop:576 length:300 start_codon:yes stop_codon:yes gene_type:complete
MYEQIRAAGVNVLGISKQDELSHRRFAAANSLPYPLLVDRRKRTIRAFGVNGPFGFGVRRATFAIGSDGVIVDRLVDDFFIGNHLGFINEALPRLKQKL